MNRQFLILVAVAALAGEASSFAAAEPCGRINRQRAEVGGTAECECELEFAIGKVWGTGTYTDDSDLCSAALHAGVISREDGTVRYEFLR